MTDHVFILSPNDIAEISAFEMRRLESKIPDQLEREMASWNARWRKESLEFYLPQGWSFGFKLGTQLEGYFLGQPLLFFRGLTQTLWIEQLSFTSEEVGVKLIETAFRWAKDKHLQTVIFADAADLQFARQRFPALTVLSDTMAELKSSRI